jgi:exosortase
MVTCEEPQAFSRSARPRLSELVAEYRPFLPAVLIATSFLPILAIHGKALWARPHYHLFPLVIPGAVMLAIRQKPRLDRLHPGSEQLGIMLAALCWILLALSVLFVSPIGGAAAAIFTLGSVAYMLGGPELVRRLLPSGVILLLAIPLPQGVDTRVVSWLQMIVSRWSSATLDSLGIFHAMEGNVVEIGGQRLLVDQACSGINSLFTLAFGTLMYLFWERLSVIRGVLLLVSSLFWVIVGNMARIVAIVVLQTQGGIDASKGWAHWFLGLVTFGLMLGLVASTDRLLVFVGAVLSHLVAALTPRSLSGRSRSRSRSTSKAGMVASLLEANEVRTKSRSRHRSRGHADRSVPVAALPAPERSEAQEPAPPPDVVPDISPEPSPAPVVPDNRKRWTLREGLAYGWIGSWPIAMAFGFLLAAQLAMPSLSWSDILTNDTRIIKKFSSLEIDAMPPQGGSNFRRLGFQTLAREDNNSWGERSKIWSYAFGHRPAVVSLDYQFVGWHDLATCYEGAGWIKTRQRNEPRVPGEESTVVIDDFYNLQGLHGHLLFGLSDRTGRPLVIPGTESLSTSLVSKLGRWTQGRDGGGNDEVTPTYQVQLFIQSEIPLTDAERAEARAFFDAARGSIPRDIPTSKGASR